MRSGFAAAGATIDSNAIGATVSIGAVASHEPVTAIDGLIARTDAALYRAKHTGRNRVHITEEDIANDRTRMIAAVRRARQVPAEGLLPLSQRNTAVRESQLWRPADYNRNHSFTLWALPCAHVAFADSS